MHIEKRSRTIAALLIGAIAGPLGLIGCNGAEDGRVFYFSEPIVSIENGQPTGEANPVLVFTDVLNACDDIVHGVGRKGAHYSVVRPIRVDISQGSPEKLDSGSYTLTVPSWEPPAGATELRVAAGLQRQASEASCDTGMSGAETQTDAGWFHDGTLTLTHIDLSQDGAITGSLNTKTGGDGDPTLSVPSFEAKLCSTELLWAPVFKTCQALTK